MSRNAESRKEVIRRNIVKPEPPAGTRQRCAISRVEADLQTPTHLPWKPIAPPIVHIARKVRNSCPDQLWISVIGRLVNSHMRSGCIDVTWVGMAVVGIVLR